MDDNVLSGTFRPTTAAAGKPSRYVIRHQARQITVVQSSRFVVFPPKTHTNSHTPTHIHTRRRCSIIWSTAAADLQIFARFSETRNDCERGKKKRIMYKPPHPGKRIYPSLSLSHSHAHTHSFFSFLFRSVCCETRAALWGHRSTAAFSRSNGQRACRPEFICNTEEGNMKHKLYQKNIRFLLA